MKINEKIGKYLLENEDDTLEIEKTGLYVFDPGGFNKDVSPDDEKIFKMLDFGAGKCCGTCVYTSNLMDTDEMYCKNSKVLSTINEVAKKLNMGHASKVGTVAWFSCKYWKENDSMWEFGA